MKRIAECPRRTRPQQGAAALSLTLTIMAIASILAVGLSQIGAGDTRRTAHEIRHLEARAAAGMALDRAGTWLRLHLGTLRSIAPGGWMEPGRERWRSCAPALVVPPCGDGAQNLFDERWTASTDVTGLVAPEEDIAGSFRAHYVAPALRAGEPMPARSTIHVIGEGRSSDGSAHGRLIRTYGIRPVIGRPLDAPVIAAGEIGVGRGLTAIVNPDGAGAGNPVSIWSGGPARATPDHPLETCGLAEYLGTGQADATDSDASGRGLAHCPDCRCPEAPVEISSGSASSPGTGADVLDNRTAHAASDAGASRFPADLFQYVFGVSVTEAAAVAAQATMLSDCARMGPESSGLFWARGDCVIAADRVVGSQDAPVVLVVQQGSLRMEGNTALFGMVFLLDPPDAGASLRVAAPATVYGALISTGRLELGGDRLTARYERQVLENLADTAGILVEIPGTWNDYR